ncbi:MAG: NUDIX hydrolase, partial [Acidobacteria bacterium]|nr:NUDIX hydrolase [Acidobacteriota bacterium]
MKILSSREVIRNPIFRVTEEHAVAPDGFEIRRSIVQHGGSAVMLAVD